MRVLALDISTVSGWVIFQDGKIEKYGVIKHKVKGNENSSTYPYNYYEMASIMSESLLLLAIRFAPEFIIVEETNKSKNRYHQKQLEYIHCQFVGRIRNMGKMENKCRLKYISTSKWRGILAIGLSKEQRKFNKEIKGEREQNKERVLKQVQQYYEKQMLHDMNLVIGKRNQNKVKKEYEKNIEIKVAKLVRGFKVKKENKVVGQTNTKHLSVAYVNKRFNLNFKIKDNDIADAMCIGAAFIEMEKL